MTETKITPSQLDFDSIKSSLKSWFASNPAFADYNFEGSTISALLDVLAYNTHLQAMQANFALNEAFLDTAQLRSSVVSLAKSMNYTPKSRNSALITVDIQFNNVPDNTAAFTLPKYTKISSNIDGIVYNFYTLDEYEANAANDYKLSGVRFYEGRLVTKRFVVDSDQIQVPIYIIPDPNLFFESVTVLKKDGLSATDNFVALQRPSTVADFNASADIYLMQEAPNGSYELILGDSIMGSKPAAGTVIDCTYLSTAGPVANGAKTFSGTITANGYGTSLTINGQATGGAERESIDSIKINAPRSYAAQNRAVTVYDYKTLIYNALTNVEALSAWGGEDNLPPEYGVVFVSIKPTDADALNESQKTQLLVNVLNPRKIANTEIRFVDPELQFIQIKSSITFDPNQTYLSKQQLENLVRDKIIEYGVENLTNFESKFYKSKFLAFLDSIDKSIVNSDAEIRMQRRLLPEYGVKARYDVRFTLPIAGVSTADHVIQSDQFEYEVNGSSYTCYLRNKKGTTRLEVYRSAGSGDVIVVDDAGYIDTTTNTLVILPFEPESAPFADVGIKITAIPANQNVLTPSRNLLLRIDESLTNATASTIYE